MPGAAWGGRSSWRAAARPRAQAVVALAVLLIGVIAARTSDAERSHNLAHGQAAYTNPVYSAPAESAVAHDDFPDPSVLRVGATYYAYATEGTQHVRAITSQDMAHWGGLHDALPQLPRWSEPGYVWAPSVAQVGGGFVLWYTTRERATGLQCLSVATADDPAGPFTDATTGPTVCQPDEGGSIDPDLFLDPVTGRATLVWKSEGVRGRAPTRLWSQPLSSDGLAPVGAPRQLLVQDQAWEFPIIEGPAMAADSGRYYLFYAGGPWQSDDYAIGYAVCDTPAGPCRKPQDRPLWSRADGEVGPGAPGFFTDAQGARWLTYHAWDHGAGYPDGGTRDLRYARLAFFAGVPVVDPPERARVASPLRGFYTLTGDGQVHAWDGAPYFGSPRLPTDSARQLLLAPGGAGYTVVDAGGRGYAFPLRPPSVGRGYGGRPAPAATLGGH